MAVELSHDILDFVQRFQKLQVHRDTSNNLVRDLLLYCERIELDLHGENKKLSQELQNAKLDLSDATASRRELQQCLLQSEMDCNLLSQENDALKNRNPYVLLLVDGDGLIFQDKWIRQGIEGGKRAAYALRSAIAAECNPCDDVEIVCKVVCNLGGLSRALLRGGHIESMNDFKEFTLGFTQAKASFDFIDVGHGKERADSKIKEMTNWNMRNHNCKQILLGVSHDAGYAPFLDEILRDETTRQRVTLVEAVPTVRELRATNVHILNLAQDLFRGDKIVDHKYERSGSVPFATTASTSPSISGSSIVRALTPASSYAGAVTSASPPPQITLPFALKPAKAKKPDKPVWSPGPRGLDEPIIVNLQAMESIKKRKDSNKLCNNHFLRGPCMKGDACSFVHNYKPSSEERKAIAALTRQNPCTTAQECGAEDCIYGHHCPSIKDGWCTHPYCKFPEDLHPPGTKFKNAYIKEN